VLCKEVRIACIERLRFIEVSLASVPLATPARDVQLMTQNLAVIGQELDGPSLSNASQRRRSFKQA
jgi:hypothetical protein